MFSFHKLLILTVVFQAYYALPVRDSAKQEPENIAKERGFDNLEYHRYLSEVVEALESDPEFKQKLKNTTEEEIRSGKIADALELVSHHVRTKLDEIKRIEIERLNKLIKKRQELQENNNIEDPTHKHLDHSNPHTFEIEDLKKLIEKSQDDLLQADKLRKEEFKEYEMYKEYDRQKKLNSTSGEERTKLENEFKQQEEKHKKHEKLHEPGHKAQLEEVWQEQDQMQQEFDPKTFFLLHDMDSNGYWDQNEVKALFLKELDKMYQAGAPEDDIRERIEEMERMRESVFQEIDTNRDGLIDYQEFLAQTKRQDFNEDHGWNGLDEQKPYTDEELQEYISRHQQQFQQHPPPVQYGGQMPAGYQNLPPQAQFHPGQVPQHAPQQIPGNMPDLHANSVYPPHPNAVPQTNFHPNQVQQQQPNQAYQQQQPNQAYQPQHPNQAYQQQHPNQAYQQQQPNQAYHQQQPNQAYQNYNPSQGNPQQQQNNPSQQAAYHQENQGNVQNNFQHQQVNQGNIPHQNSQQHREGSNQQNVNQNVKENIQNNQASQQQNIPPQAQAPVVSRV